MVRVVSWVVVVLTAGACGDTDGRMPDASGGRAFGEPCRESADCNSALCLPVSSSRSVCTRACAGDAECPDGSSWACVESTELGASRVCGCTATGSEESCGDGLDNDCDGATDDCRICDGRAVPEDDPLHCGACSNACRADQACLRGTCACTDPSLVACGDGCVDLASSREHCGACDQACGIGQLCQSGRCVCPAPGPSDYCEGVGCVDLDSDGAHCGACDTPCSPAQTCNDGICECPNEGDVLCLGVGCVDLVTDSEHCGTCSRSCSGATSCVAAACSCPAATPRLCGDRCVDTLNDPSHCGRCDRACSSGLTCADGNCVCGVSGTELCDGDCHNLMTDPLHCGGCGRACGSGESCVAGECSCESGLYCAGSCVSASDRAHCGACGRACGPMQSCSGGRCVCPSGRTACGIECPDLASDPANCGSCGYACGGGASCLSGTCRCATGTHCPSTGCVDLRTSSANCGACGFACRPGETCSGGACVCPTGSRYCASAGACVDIRSSALHCGACDRACGPALTCAAGVCRCPRSGDTFCASAGACVDLENDSLHCGMCDAACAPPTTCVAGDCDCPAGQTLCGATCAVLATDRDHCGRCGAACPGATSCVGGVCSCPVTVGRSILIDASSAIYSLRGATGGGRLALVWFDSDLPAGRVALVDDTGALLAGMPRDLVPAGVSGGREVVWNGTSFVAYWPVRLADGRVHLLGQAIGTDGVFVGSPVDVSATVPSTIGALLEPDAEYLPGAAVALLGDGDRDLYFQRLGADGLTPDAPVLVSATSPTGYTLGTGGGGFGATYTSGGVRYFQAITAAGTIPAPAIRADGGGLVYDGASWVVLDYDGGTERVLLRRGSSFESTSVAMSGILPRDLSLSARGSTLFLTYHTGYSSVSDRLSSQRYSAPVDTTAPIVAVPPSWFPADSVDVSYDPYVALPLGTDRFATAWPDERPGVGRGLRASVSVVGACP